MTNPIYPKKRKETKHPYSDIWSKFEELYLDKIGTIPEINYGSTGRLIKKRLENHSIAGLIKILEMFFEHEKDIVFDLKTALSTFFINKYAPKLKLDPCVYSNAEEWNKKVY